MDAAAESEHVDPLRGFKDDAYTAAARKLLEFVRMVNECGHYFQMRDWLEEEHVLRPVKPDYVAFKVARFAAGYTNAASDLEDVYYDTPGPWRGHLFVEWLESVLEMPEVKAAFNNLRDSAKRVRRTRDAHEV